VLGPVERGASADEPAKKHCADDNLGNVPGLLSDQASERQGVQKLTVDGQVLDNFFDRPGATPTPIPARGPIELQTHNSEMRFRNIYVREIPAGGK